MAETLEERFERAMLEERLRSATEETPRAPEGASPAAVGMFSRAITLFGAGFNEGLANVLGMPADLFSVATRAVGLGDVPIGGSESIKRGMRAVGLATKRDVPGGEFLKRVGEEVGATVAPTGAALGLARRGVQAAGLLRPFAEQPARAVATEGALALGGGVGAGVAGEVVPGSLPLEVAGQVGGSFTAALPVAVAQRGVGAVRRMAEPFTASGIERRAAASLQGSVARPREQVLGDLERGTTAVREAIGVTPTTAQAAGDPGLLALERSVSRGSPAAKGALEDIIVSERQAVRRAAEGVVPEGRPEAVREALETTKRQAEEVGRLRLLDAEQRVTEALTRTTDPLEANRIIRQSLAEAEGAAQEQARELFRRVGDVRGPVDRLHSAAQSIRSAGRKVERVEDMPEVVGVVLKLGRPEAAPPSGLLGARGEALPATPKAAEPVPIDELMALRSRISQDVREEFAQAAPNRLRVSRLEQLKDAVDDTITQDFGDAGPLYEEARQFFRREVADRFRRGTVAEVLRSGALGEPGRVPQSGIIARFFRAGRGAPEAAQDFNRVLGDDQAARAALRDGAVQQFANFATRADGRFDPQRARQWRARFKDALREFPDVDTEVGRITRLGDDAAQVRLGVDKSLQRFQDSGLRFFLEADPDRAVKAALGSKNPTEDLRTLVRAVRQSPEALQGLRGAVWSHALERAETRTFDEAIGRAFLSPGRMREFMRANERHFLASGLYSKDEMARVGAIVRAAEVVDRSVTTGLTGGSDTAANLQALRSLTGLTLPGLWSRFYSIARGVVSPRFVISEITSRVGQRILNKVSDEKVGALMAQALKDPDVARTLLMRDTEMSPLLVARRLHGHLVNLGPVTMQRREEREPVRVGPEAQRAAGGARPGPARHYTAGPR